MVRIAHGAAVCTPAPPRGPHFEGARQRTSSATVGTDFGVDTGVIDAQPFHRVAVYEMLFHDLLGILGPDSPVPDCIRINYHGRPVLALVETQGFVNANAIGQTSGLGKLLQLGKDFALSVAGARRARCAFGPDIMTNENVMLEKGQ